MAALSPAPRLACHVVTMTLTPQGFCLLCTTCRGCTPSQVHQLLNNWSEPQKANFIRHVTREYEVSCCCARSPQAGLSINASSVAVASALQQPFRSWVGGFLDGSGTKMESSLVLSPLPLTTAVACCFPSLLSVMPSSRRSISRCDTRASSTSRMCSKYAAILSRRYWATAAGRTSSACCARESSCQKETRGRWFCRWRGGSSTSTLLR